MKLVSYYKTGHDQLAVMHNDHLHDLDSLNTALPSKVADFLIGWDKYYPLAVESFNALHEGGINVGTVVPLESVKLLAPVPFPTSCRDGYSFRQHVAAARRNRKVDMIAEFDQYPIFYFTNHHGIQGPGEVSCMPDHFEKLDFELEAAIVICRKGRNIKAEEADEYIGGLMIMNDLSARRLQMEEMLLVLESVMPNQLVAMQPALVYQTPTLMVEMLQAQA